MKQAERYQFKIGEKVSWVSSGSSLFSSSDTHRIGAVISIDDTEHKATIKYNDDEGNEKIDEVDYDELTKIPN